MSLAPRHRRQFLRPLSLTPFLRIAVAAGVQHDGVERRFVPIFQIACVVRFVDANVPVAGHGGQLQPQTARGKRNVVDRFLAVSARSQFPIGFAGGLLLRVRSAAFMVQFFPNGHGSVERARRQNSAVLGMGPLQFPHRTLVGRPIVRADPRFVGFALGRWCRRVAGPNFDPMVRTARCQRLPVVVVRDVVHEVAVLKVDGVADLHGGLRLPQNSICFCSGSGRARSSNLLGSCCWLDEGDIKYKIKNIPGLATS